MFLKQLFLRFQSCCKRWAVLIKASRTVDISAFLYWCRSENETFQEVLPFLTAVAVDT